MHLVAEGALRSPIEVEAPWSEIATVAHTFYNRGIPGKAVLRL